MKIIFKALVITLVASQQLFAQRVELINEEIRATSYQNKSYLVTKSLTIRPPSGGGVFRVSAATHGTFFIRMAQGTSVPINQDVSTNQNYIRTEAIIEGNVASEDAINSLSNSQLVTTYQYLDDHGRVSQVVSQGRTPAGKDVILPSVYDVQGWQRLQYLPYAGGTADGSFRASSIADQSTFYTSTPKVIGDGNPYSEYTFEKSELGRVKESYGQGQQWRSNSKKVTTSESMAGINVPRWTISSSTGYPVTSANYTENVLRCVTNISENGKTTKTYSDFRGITVREEDASLATVFIYNEIGQLRFVLPPRLTSSTPTPTQVDQWGFQYTYDERGRRSQEKKPGADWIYYVYDQWDRLVAKQDGNQRDETVAADKEWTYFKYDEFNRVVITGGFKSDKTHNQMKSAVAGNHHENAANNSVGYTLTESFPRPSTFASVTESNIRAITYYDSYAFLTYSGWDAESNNYTFSNPVGFANTKLDPAKGMPTGAKVKVLNDTKWLNSAVYYDNNYRTIQSISENHLSGGLDKISYQYNFPGWVTRTFRTHTSSLGSVTALEEMEYDHSGRLLKLYHTLDGGIRTLVTSNSYNEIGQLVENNIHSTNSGASFLQSVDFRYNIRGWLTHINNSTLSVDANNDDSNDLFGLEIVFNEEQPLIYNGQSNISIPKNYNGSVSAVKWKTNNLRDTPKERIFGFIYDTNDRLINSAYAAKTGGNWNDEAGLYTEDNISYDPNGSIKTLVRNAKINGAKDKLDDLSYNNDGTASTGNQLLRVDDDGNDNLGFVDLPSGGSVVEYEYDANANLRYDINRAITRIDYNYLDLPEKVIFDNGATSVELMYDASGYLVRKIYKRFSSEEFRVDYAKGIQYYNGSLAQVFIPGGRASKFNGSWEYEYYLKDHLGSTRLIFGHVHDADSYKATMEPYYDQKERADFRNMPVVPDNALNHTARNTEVPTPEKSVWLKGSVSGREVGPAKMLTVTAGDKISMEVYARYVAASGNNVDVVVDMLAAATTGMQINTMEGATAYAGFSNSYPGLVNGMSYTGGLPKAYLNYILFDANFANPQFGFVQISSGANFGWERLALDVTVNNTGYAYIFVANESDYSVYFDDLQVIHHKNTKSLRVTESTDFYPYGLEIEGTRYVDPARIANNYGFQGDFSEFDERTGWNRFKHRGNYDPRLGIWLSPDPLGHVTPGFSVYAGMMNGPSYRVDPDGRIAPLVIAGAALIGGIGNLSSNWDKITDWRQGLSYFATGATTGAVALVNPVAAAGILTAGNVMTDLAYGHTPDPTQLAVDAAFTFVGGKTTANGLKAFDDAYLKVKDVAEDAARKLSEFRRWKFSNWISKTPSATKREAVEAGIDGLTDHEVVVTATEEVVAKASIQGFRSFSAFKRAMGPAGPGQAWHHIVEQTPGNLARFGNETIHTTGNLMKLPHGAGSIHARVSGYYSSIQPFTGGQTVRQWLGTQSYQAQYDFGIQTLRNFGWVP